MMAKEKYTAIIVPRTAGRDDSYAKHQKFELFSFPKGLNTKKWKKRSSYCEINKENKVVMIIDVIVESWQDGISVAPEMLEILRSNVDELFIRYHAGKMQRGLEGLFDDEDKCSKFHISFRLNCEYNAIVDVMTHFKEDVVCAIRKHWKKDLACISFRYKKQYARTITKAFRNLSATDYLVHRDVYVSGLPDKEYCIIPIRGNELSMVKQIAQALEISFLTWSP